MDSTWLLGKCLEKESVTVPWVIFPMIKLIYLYHFICYETNLQNYVCKDESCEQGPEDDPGTNTTAPQDPPPLK